MNLLIFLEFICIITSKFSADKIAICKIPVILDNHEANVKLDELIKAITEDFGSGAGF